MTATPVELNAGEWSVLVGDRHVGPRCSKRVASGVCRWLNAGGLADLSPSGPVLEVAALLGEVDQVVEQGRALLGPLLGRARGMLGR